MKPNETQLFSIYRAGNSAIRDGTASLALKYLAAAIERWEAIRPKDQATPEPLAFPDPPHGYAFHNPENLTPEQVGISSGWRLMVEGELRADGTQWWNDHEFEFVPGAKHRLGDSMGMNTTYRTKAPLPAPKPTPEEIERQEIGIAFDSAEVGIDDFSAFEAGFRAAKKGLTTP